MANSPPPLLLLVEDDPGDAELLRLALLDAGPRLFTVETRETLAAAKAFLAGQTPAVILLDLSLPDSFGLETISVVHALAPTIPIVVLTGNNDPDFALSALAAGAQDYLIKGAVSSDSLVRAIRYAQARSQLEARLLKVQQRQEALLAAVPDIIMEVDNNKVYAWANRAGLAFFGPAVVGRPAAGFFEGEQDIYRQVEPLFTGQSEVVYVESWQRRHDGEKRLLAWWCRALKDGEGRVTGVLSSARDVTDQRKLEEQLRQAQKMESIGTLAGGIAHDFNNILTAVIGYGQIALMGLPANDPQRLNVENMVEAAKRGAHLTQSLLLFSRKQSSDRRPMDFNQVLERLEKFLKRIIGEDIDCHIKPGEKPLPILADAHQLEQVLMNLATNARDAMPGGGSFTICAERIELDRDFVSVHAYGRPGPYLRISVSDTGSGMSTEIREHIFEPFYTTKEVGKGTGLGLAVVYGIIHQHEGYINLYSEPGQGTTFRIYLPLIAMPGRENGEIAGEEQAPRGGKETILVAEDDEAIRKLTRTVLERFGYTVIEAADGQEAIERFQEQPDEIDLLLFDLVMPRMNGKEACDAIRRLKPGIRALFASGYAPDLLRQKMALDNGTPLLYKPMSLNDLLHKVRMVLDGPEARP